jgi:hypothetical protein
MRSRRQHRAYRWNINEFSRNRCRGIQLSRAERGAVSNRGGLPPRNARRCLGDRESTVACAVA